MDSKQKDSKVNRQLCYVCDEESHDYVNELLEKGWYIDKMAAAGGGHSHGYEIGCYVYLVYNLNN